MIWKIKIKLSSNQLLPPPPPTMCVRDNLVPLFSVVLSCSISAANPKVRFESRYPRNECQTIKRKNFPSRSPFYLLHRFADFKTREAIRQNLLLGDSFHKTHKSYTKICLFFSPKSCKLFFDRVPDIILNLVAGCIWLREP
jgi:hypothetical protein